MKKPPIITRAKVQGLIPLTDCGGRIYPEDEREDLVRHMIWAAENQRDADIDYYKNLTSPMQPTIECLDCDWQGQPEDLGVDSDRCPSCGGDRVMDVEEVDNKVF